MKTFNNKYMELAIKKAKKCLTNNKEVPVACVIVNNKTNKVIAISQNKIVKNNDPTAHAEILAIRKACKKIGNYRLEDASMFITLEPCHMCLEAIKLARIKNVYFGAYSYNKKPSFSNLEIIGGFYEEECSTILNNFFQSKR